MRRGSKPIWVQSSGRELRIPTADRLIVFPQSVLEGTKLPHDEDIIKIVPGELAA